MKNFLKYCLTLGCIATSDPSIVVEASSLPQTDDHEQEHHVIVSYVPRSLSKEEAENYNKSM